MYNFFIEGGIYMWPLLILAIVILFQTVKNGIDLFVTKNASQIKIKQRTDSILFWGGFSALLGIFAHFHGIYLAMQAIMAANDISPGIVAHGYACSLITMLSGLFILIISSILWFFFQRQVK